MMRVPAALVAAACAALAACGGGGGSTPPQPGATSTPTLPPPPAGTPTPIPLGSPTTNYYLTSITPANGVPAYISDPIVLTFSQQPDYNGANTTEDAISVAPLTAGVPTPLATGFLTAPSLPNEVGVKFYAQAGASYRISIAPGAQSASGSAYSGVSTFTVTLPTTPPLPPRVAPPIGSPYFYGLSPGQINAQVGTWLGQLHPAVVRIGADMSGTENTQGTFTYAGLDSLLEQAKSLGIAVDLLLTQYNAPGWASQAGSNPPPSGSGYIPCTPGTFASWVASVVGHVTSSPNYPPPAAIEIGNEPDTPNFWQVYSANPTCNANAFTTTSDPTPYIPYLQQAYAAAKAVAPGETFLNAGVATNSNDEAYFAALVSKASASVDAWAVHLYAWSDPNSPDPAHSWEAFKVLTDDMAVAGPSKQFWVTEGAFTTNPYCNDAVDPQTQAYFLAEEYDKMAALSAPSVASFIYFELQDQSAPTAPLGGADPCFEPAGVGLVDSSGNQRPAFTTYENLISGI